ncbi:hypothetical protein NIES2135_15380 [Leptolyngbya boryana NIES-2135]|jgi:hypothetical protein|uniref:Uncharacterized protein n=1 Tax=Leptolyngbya boryana NIES-2135 TaxID=1973484 RepID=A0A1Z4JDD5_LEPBY|nr:hypothetical protein LBWT_49120 [Leptolyngbya boryana IAM M-101]BAS65292.1 hypothetical protein LBDG_49120 [Leptolyngbya boryana dg5]BAY54720.1 hypothetical protein NIES2135_15380 [Leptolyngbya boryana NIES-2135]
MIRLEFIVLSLAVIPSISGSRAARCCPTSRYNRYYCLDDFNEQGRILFDLLCNELGCYGLKKPLEVDLKSEISEFSATIKSQAMSITFQKLKAPNQNEALHQFWSHIHSGLIQVLGLKSS